jgi:hypothetical protein
MNILYSTYIREAENEERRMLQGEVDVVTGRRRRMLQGE